MALPHASSTKVPPNLKQRESVKLKGRVKKGKQEPMDHHQTQHSPNSLTLFATDSLELKLAGCWSFRDLPFATHTLSRLDLFAAYTFAT